MAAARIKVLMFAEAVTLAHVARPLSLAKALDPERYEVVIACDPRYARFVADGPWRHVGLASIPSAQFIRALAHGTPVYSLPTLQSYLRQDLALIEAIQPDLVVGDFRLSLSVSSRLAQRPYATITNAYWSPSFRGGFALPVLPVTRLLPLAWAARLFDLLRPAVFVGHCRPLNRLRQQNGMPSLGADLRRVYTDADHLLIADSPALFPMEPLPGNESFIGPLLWSPVVPLPAWWGDGSTAQLPSVYVSLGSSGPPALLSTVLAALEGLPLQVIASTAGAPMPRHVPANARVAAYLPGDAATQRASLVVCNGGSLTVQQALSTGVPVLGLASNMDQFMNMEVIEAAGAGKVLRIDRLSVASIRAACQELLQSPVYGAAARGLRSALRQGPDAAGVFERVAKTLLTKPA
jgi:UDP:flavonoid glycosyltransferase YjiC (YdhE family)